MPSDSENSSGASECETFRNEDVYDDVTNLRTLAVASINEGDYKKAYETLKSASDLIDKITEALSEDIKSLKTSIKSNMSLCSLKLENYYDVVNLTNELLNSNPENCKLLHRRGVAFTNMKHFKEALADFTKLKQLKYSGSDELITFAKTRMQIHEQRDRAACRAIFQEPLYDDRERQVRELKEKEAREREAKAKELDELKRSGKEPKETTLDEYIEREKKRIEDENQAKRLAAQNRVLGRTTSTGGVINTDELELDEEEKKLISETKKKGYCYFRRELTQEEKTIRDTVNVPHKIENAEQFENNKTKVISAWNASKTTYEEKDATKWAKTMLETVLESIKTDNVEVTNVDLNGEAAIIVARGSLRHFYDFEINFDVKLKANKETQSIHFTLSQFAYDKLEEAVKNTLATFYNKYPKQSAALDEFSSALIQSIKQFEQQYTDRT